MKGDLFDGVVGGAELLVEPVHQRLVRVGLGRVELHLLLGIRGNTERHLKGDKHQRQKKIKDIKLVRERMRVQTDTY